MLLEEAEKGQITGTHTSRGLYQRGLSVFYAQFFSGSKEVCGGGEMQAVSVHYGGGTL